MSYHPTLGRWVTADPAEYVDGPNLYQHVGSNPVNRVDPSGLAGMRPNANTYICCIQKCGPEQDENDM